MSKQAAEDLAPPPYSETPSFPRGAPHPNPSLYTSHLAAHLTSLPDRLRESKQAHSAQQAADDLDLVTRIIPHIEAFLADITSLPRSPPLAELTLVPAPAVSPGWSLSGAAERRREGELVQVARVEVPGPLSLGDKKGGIANSSTAAPVGAAAYSATTSGLPPERDWSAPQFDEWGREVNGAGPTSAAGSGASAGQEAGSWWWLDEQQAQRLARVLQPSRPPARVERRATQQAAVVVQPAAAEDRKGIWRWGKKKSSAGDSSASSTTSSTPATPTPKSPSLISSGAMEASERVRMVVRPEEVTFNKENELGLLESLSGFGIVVVVTIGRG